MKKNTLTMGGVCLLVGPNGAGKSHYLANHIKHNRYYHDYQLTELRRSGSPANSGTTLEPSGLNVFSVLMEWQGSSLFFERYIFVLDILQEAFPSFVSELSFTLTGQTVSIEVHSPHSKHPIAINNLSNGFLQMLLHLTAICSLSGKETMAIDEPENSLHPAAIKKLIAALREKAQENELTVLLGTHSGYILNEFKGFEHQVYVMNNKKIERLDKISDKDWLEHFSLSDLYGKQF